MSATDGPKSQEMFGLSNMLVADCLALAAHSAEYLITVLTEHEFTLWPFPFLPIRNLHRPKFPGNFRSVCREGTKYFLE
jgi:hypothetical protein